MNSWKGTKVWICQEPGMELFMALMNNPKRLGYGERQLDIFPGKLATNCKCKNCRYTRWRKRKLEEV